MKDFTYIAIIAALFLFSFHQYSKKNDLEQTIKTNLEARKDSISYYKNQLGQTVAEKKPFKPPLKKWICF